MREILFRGKTTKKDGNKAFNNIWVEGDLVRAGISGIYIHPQANTFVVDNELTKFVVMHEVIPETVGQFTGLTDKNGRKIFEGDILTNILGDLFVMEFPVPNEDSKDYRGKPLYPMPWQDCREIIGNIHDNPELLEVAK